MPEGWGQVQGIELETLVPYRNEREETMSTKENRLQRPLAHYGS